MSRLKEFQSRYGAQWASIVGSESFGAGLALASQEKIERILILDDDEIAARSAIILADLRGHLRYEAALLGLHERKELVFGELPEPEYPDPSSEKEEEFSDLDIDTSPGPPTSSIQPVARKPKPKKRRRKSK